ncbi:hypothetical protein P171DRAFT_431311 [Karstenula rhodostoma CBS 690.94]|uniref:Uncharacterized protein n=1 Tax=Karstenula rhodostoma CBS 690.94 TaxID=1392251 RepID=A0A9P4PKM9_9PLEO|nr:hypothetical protein P171DRAFT_431311 [Karstenula rhodostoma CBS 690.94]
MAHPSLTGIPFELRERIFEYLLSHTPTPSPTPAPASPLCALLTLNRQIHAEIIAFLRSQLLVLIKTNDEEFIGKSLDATWGPTPMLFLSQLRSRDLSIQKSAANAPIAMELEFYMFMSDKDATSTAAFLVPARELATVVDAQKSPSFYIWTMQALLSVKFLDSFSHAQDEAEKLLLNPYTSGFLLPVFAGVSTAGVSPSTTSLLREKLKGDYKAGAHLQKLQSLLNCAVDGAEDDWEAAAGKFGMATCYGEMVWENHEECMGAWSPFDGVHHLWIMHANVCAGLVQVLLNIAAGGPIATVPTGDKDEENAAFVEARRAAEDAIRFLSKKREWGMPETADLERAMIALRKSKAKISFRAHAACKGMGDVDAAVGYLREALKYEPETSEMLSRRIEGLKEEGARDEEDQGVVEWE